MKLDIGTIEPRKGYMTLDLRLEADIVADAAHTGLASNSVDHIISNHMIEHVTREEGIACILEWHRILKSGGILDITTPSLERLCRLFTRKDESFWGEAKRFTGHTFAEKFNNLFRGYQGNHKYIWGEGELMFGIRGVFREAEHVRPDKKIHGTRDTSPRKQCSIIIRAVK